MELGLNRPECDSFPDKHVKRIHRALDSDDVELVRMLLREARTTLDHACALHYAVAYCDAKTTTELLDLGIADINQRNPRGYTVLHVAALRKEPKIIVSLLVKGAGHPTSLWMVEKHFRYLRGSLGLRITINQLRKEKLLPRSDCVWRYWSKLKEEIFLLGEAALSLAIAGDDLRKKLLYLENRGDFLVSLLSSM